MNELVGGPELLEAILGAEGAELGRFPFFHTIGTLELTSRHLAPFPGTFQGRRRHQEPLLAPVFSFKKITVQIALNLEHLLFTRLIQHQQSW